MDIVIITMSVGGTGGDGDDDDDEEEEEEAAAAVVQAGILLAPTHKQKFTCGVSLVVGVGVVDGDPPGDGKGIKANEVVMRRRSSIKKEEGVGW